MKYLSIALISLFTVQFLAQDEKVFEITFKNGETKKFEFIYDDPNALPPWQVELRPFNAVIFSDITMAFMIKPIYRLDEKIWLDMGVISAYGKSADALVGYNSTDRKEFKAYLDINPQVHYRLVNFDKVKVKTVGIDYIDNGSQTVMYRIEMPRKTTRGIDIDGGININRRTASIGLDPVDTNNITRYFVGTSTFVSTSVGISLHKSQSLRFKTDDKPYSYWNRSRWYGYITYSLFEKNSVYYSDINSQSVPATSGFKDPFVTKLGYRIGWEKTLGLKNTSSGILVGFEFGALPYLQPRDQDFYTLSSYNKMPYGFFTMHFGYTFGGKIY